MKYERPTASGEETKYENPTSSGEETMTKVKVF